MKVNFALTPDLLRPDIDQFWKLSAAKLRLIDRNFDTSKGAPVFTIGGQYSTRGWTEWTQGFQFGSALLQFDATGEEEFLESGRKNTLEKMPPHLSHTGVHDHGFNNISTYGNLLRMMKEGKIARNEWEKNFYELAIRVSGAVQAMRWTRIKDGGFIYSFNGPHSLFVDTVRSCRSLMVAHLLGHTLMGENDEKINLLHRAIQHLLATAKFSVFYGEGRDHYDVWGRTAHEIIFNVNDGRYRCPNAQQGFSGFTTWTRGLAWAICGFAEELELIENIPAEDVKDIIDKQVLLETLQKGCLATCDFYLENSAADGIPYWDTGAPGLIGLGDYRSKPADPYNDFEPVDSSAACIAAQGFLRFGKYLEKKKHEAAKKYWQAGLTICNTILKEPYLSTNVTHEGLVLHSVYHRPNGWDYIPKGRKIPCGESSMWGDYHARELMLYITKRIRQESYYTFYDVV
jgi:rhamnogalacturonyl hydrolase YesR